MKVCRCVVSYTCMFTRASWTWPRVVSQAPGQSSAGQGYNVCTFGSCFTSCLWPTLPQVQDWLAALDLGPRKDATPSFSHSFPPKLPQSACPGERRPPRFSTCSDLCSSSWTMTDRHLWIISIAGHYPIRTIWWPRDSWLQYRSLKQILKTIHSTKHESLSFRDSGLRLQTCQPLAWTFASYISVSFPYL